MSPSPFLVRLRAEAAHLVTSLTTFGPSTGRRWPLAIQSGLAMAVPIVGLALTGHADIALLAASGAFTVIYGGWLRPRQRARFAPIMALALFACAAAGVLAAGGGTIVVLVGGLALTIVAASLAGWFSLGPPGPVFFVLVYGLSAQVTAVRGGVRVVDPWVYLAVVAASSAFACVLVLLPLLLPRYRHEQVRPVRALFPRRWDGVAQTLAVRAAIVAVVGVGAAAFIDPERSYWIICAGLAVVGMPVGRRAAAARGIHRTVGTIVGGAVYLGLALLPLPIWALGLLLGALQVAVELTVVRHYALALVFITPLVLLIIGAATGEGANTALALERVVDTLVGAVVGTIAALAVRLRDERG
ncbi:MAG: FUSC family protein [Microbacterium sp.]|uniref:FUSC family protein n=1 Tax=Microbacterium sp. TaxID=51671 RepID=UPI001ACEC559|nr:FUSC family protein [Microbacterium sp.]MBN9178168.1 FUSC family protein [Microbacterium sp.]